MFSKRNNLHLYTDRRINLITEFFFLAKLNAFPFLSLETIIFCNDSSRHLTNRIELRRRFHRVYFPHASSSLALLLPMKSTVSSRTRVYLFAARSAFDPLKRDPYAKKHRLASPFDLWDRIDCSRWIFRATRYRRSAGFHADPTMGTAMVRGTTFLRLGEVNWNPEGGGYDPVICGAKGTP